MISGCGRSNVTTQDATENTASEEVDVSECTKGCNILYHDDDQKQSCYDICKAANKISSDDIEDCNEIQDTDSSFITKDVCIQSKAVQMKKPEYCDMVEDKNMKDSCYLGVADEMNDKSLCQKIENSILKLGCENTEE